MKLKILAVTLLAAFVLAACNEESADEGKTALENEPQSVKETQNIKEMVQQYSANKAADQTASITAKELIVKDSEGKETVYDLSGEDFFVSIAPYINGTHP
ncbi:PBP1b-binding outer membrane lipoprotein LpoB [Bacillus benzoevorans]|uniref:PBP1b-binding outer membrane lipoprotein LpoB n=3 Tax=Bacillus benzoevorans TaxID=1456 RepID=A0A7X0LWU5_9BACI|nr:PBP1b-binding outer membrane lipoprotein LpoB [Bacillus benzoevorans]